MKRLVFLTLCLVLVFSMSALANQGNPYDGLTQDIPASVEVGPYASVMAQKLVYDGSEEVWGWVNFLWWKLPVRLGWEHYWSDDEQPLMSFEHYSGKAGQSKFTDSNGFVVETNTPLTLTFNGTRLENSECPDSKMLTTYWAFTAEGVDGSIWPVPNWGLFPAQVIPDEEIGFFGEGPVPRYDGGFSHTGVLAGLAHVITGLEASQFWPKQADVVEDLSYAGIDANGIFAFQVFGFAGTDDISSQRAGDYEATITLTVAAP